MEHRQQRNPTKPEIGFGQSHASASLVKLMVDGMDRAGALTATMSTFTSCRISLDMAEVRPAPLVMVSDFIRVFSRRVRGDRLWYGKRPFQECGEWWLFRMLLSVSGVVTCQNYTLALAHSGWR